MAFSRLNHTIIPAIDWDCTPTRAAEQILTQALKPWRRTVEDCLLEVSTNSAAAVLELARIILADTPDEYRRYQQTFIARTEAGINALPLRKGGPSIYFHKR